MLKCELFCSGNSISQQDIEDIGKTNLNKIGKNKHYPITPIEVDEKEYIKQNDINYNNINIKFPFEPYNEQIKYIQSIIDTLKNKEKTALESPTGTGKTLSLLTASLSFLKYIREDLKKKNKSFLLTKPPSIIFTTRTHEEINNIINELWTTCYRPRTCILGSRDLYCINDKNSKNKNNNITKQCQINLKTKTCPYFNPNKKFKKNELDMKTLLEIKQKCAFKKICPFYAELDRYEHSDLILMPYSYLFNERIRKKLDIKTTNAIILIDEAHNIPEVCSDSLSKTITVNNLKYIIKELNELQIKISRKLLKNNLETCIKKLKLSPDNINLIELEKLIDRITTFKKYFEGVKFETDTNNIEQNEKIIEENELFSSLYKLFITEDKEIIENDSIFNSLLKDDYDNSKISSNKLILLNKKFTQIINSLSDWDLILNYNKLYNYTIENYIEFLEILNLIIDIKLKNTENEQKENFIFLLSKPSDKKSDNKHTIKSDTFNNLADINNRFINIICVNPGIGFNRFLKNDMYSLILTSGTLYPIEIFESNLNFKFWNPKRFNHIIDKEQIQVNIIAYDFITGNEKLYLTEKNKYTYNAKKTIQITIGILIDIIPGGIIVYFTSYNMIKEYYDYWKKIGFIKTIENKRQLFVDTKEKNSKTDIMNMYKASNYSDKNGIFFTVFKGVSSEGVNFKNEECRAVLILGIPLISINDIKCNMKKHYLDKIQNNNLTLNLNSNRPLSEEWYYQNAFININQAIGRIIRNAKDYGLVFLFDYRYSENCNLNLLSNWTKEKISYITKHRLTEFKNETENFFKEMKLKFNKKPENITININNNVLNINNNVINPLFVTPKKPIKIYDYSTPIITINNYHEEIRLQTYKHLQEIFPELVIRNPFSEFKTYKSLLEDKKNEILKKRIKSNHLKALKKLNIDNFSMNQINSGK